MSSTSRLGLACASLVLVLLPLALVKPGLPTHLKADEAAYYGMALSLAHDGDLLLEPRDVDRFFAEFPYRPVNNLILMTRDGWQTVSFGKPFVYSLLAAPFARLLGADGILLLNALLLVALVWMGAGHLWRHNDEGSAALFAVGFYLLSLAFTYTFWIQPEVFNMAAVSACLYLGLPRDEEAGLRRPRRDLLLAALSGAALALAVYNKPMMALVGLAPLVGMARRHRLRAAAAWLVGAAACSLGLAGLSQALTGTPSAYLGVQRGGFTLCGPGQMPVAPLARPTPQAAPAGTSDPEQLAPSGSSTGGAAAAAASPTGNAWSWLLRLPDTSWSELNDNLGYFLWGRHTGLLLYLPFAALAVIFFLLHGRGRRALESWVLLASLLAVALFFLLQISWNWQGGGGFVGNRYFVNVYPGFLFLVGRLRPRSLLALGYAAGGLLLGPLLLSPFGAPVVEPTLQHHVRGAPFRFFPLELTLRNVPGYHRVPLDDLRLIGRRDALLPRGEDLWLHGAMPVELWLLADRPLGATTWELRSPAPDNRLAIRFGDHHEELRPPAGEALRLVLPARPPDREWTIFCPPPPGQPMPPPGQRKRCPVLAWRLVVESERGAIQPWTRELPPESCAGWTGDTSRAESFYLGAELSYLGSGEGLDDDVFALEWLRVLAPARVGPGESFEVRVALVNRSAATWRERGGARVRLAYHWLDEQGTVVVFDGERTELPRPIAPGETLRTLQRVVAPALPGRYQLALDPVFERVAWFSQRGVASRRVVIEVVAAPPGAAGASSSETGITATAPADAPTPAGKPATGG